MFNRRVYKFLAIVAALLIFSTIAYAFAASITVPDSNAGSGSKGIGGYTVDGIAYTLGSTPTDLDSVQLTLDTAATTVEVSMDGTTWVTCTGGPTVWSCAVGGTVLDATNLEVVAFTNVIP
jgi:hypothetical protein